MPTITTTDGLQLNYTETGNPNGRPIVLVAGFKAPATSWRYQVTPLEVAGLRVIAFDKRLHGASPAGEGPYTMERQGADIRDLLEALDLRDVTLVGGSMGGNSAWALVAQSGTARIRDIVIVDQTPKMLNTADWPHGFYDYVEANVDTYFATGIPDPGRVRLISKGFVRITRILKALDRRGGRQPLSSAELELLGDHAKRDWRPVIAGIDVPVLFVAGRQSDFWPAEHAAAAAALSPFASSVVIEKAGHATNIEQPRAFNAALRDFINR